MTGKSRRRASTPPGIEDPAELKELMVQLAHDDPAVQSKAANRLFDTFRPIALTLAHDSAQPPNRHDSHTRSRLAASVEGPEINMAEREQTALVALFHMIDRRRHPKHYTQRGEQREIRPTLSPVDFMSELTRQVLRHISNEVDAAHPPMTEMSQKEAEQLRLAQTVGAQLPQRIVRGRFGMQTVAAAVGIDTQQLRMLFDRPAGSGPFQLVAPSSADEPNWFDPNRVIDRLTKDRSHAELPSLFEILTNRERDVLRVIYLEGGTLNDAARVAEVSRSTAATTEVRALSKLATKAREQGLHEQFGLELSAAEPEYREMNYATAPLHESIGIVLAVEHGVAHPRARKALVKKLSLCTTYGGTNLIEAEPGLGHLLHKANSTPRLHGFLDEVELWAHWNMKDTVESANETYETGRRLITAVLDRDRLWKPDAALHAANADGICAVLNVRQPYGDEDLHRAVRSRAQVQSLLADYAPGLRDAMKRPAEIQDPTLQL
jgi:predicted DNA-binding protein (UPF0251 family)